jgi:Gti1/Pac2 family transcription factor
MVSIASVPNKILGLSRYQEDPVGASAMRPRRRGEHMIKQTYSVYVQTGDGMKKWHLSSS